MSRIVALVPMRHHSQRVPGKNFRPLAGKPLFHHILETLQKVPELQDVVVDTDSEPVMDGVRRFFPDVKLIERPGHLRADAVPMNDILLHDTSQIDADYYLQTHSTNPLLKAETISRAIRSFASAYPDCDSLFSVTRLQTRLYFQDGTAVNHNPGELLQTQDLPPVFEENSCLYLFRRETLLKWHHRIGQKPQMFEIAAEEAWDIDEELDFAICDFLLKRQSANG
jgi:CMP-N-acetylneuraminic acid synthetase